jgi:hypothetical protein
MSKDQLFSQLFGLLNRLRPGDVMKPAPTTNGAVWSHSDKKHVFLTPELSNDVSEKLRLPFPKKQGILMITIDAPLGGWNLTGYQHPFGSYGYGFDIVDISAERTFPSHVAQDFLDDWDGVCVIADSAAGMRFHLVRTGLFELIRRKVGIGFFYLGVNGGAVLAADDLSQIIPSGGKARGLGLIPKTILPFAEIPEVKYAVDILNKHFGTDDPKYMGIEKGQVAQFTDDVLEIR